MDRMVYKHMLQRKRAMRKRKKITGTADRPRLTVYRSLSHIYTQLIDDINQVTLLSVSSAGKDIKAEVEGKNKTAVAEAIGARLAELSKAKGIERVYFDVGPYKYHGRVKALAESVKKSGIRF